VAAALLLGLAGWWFFRIAVRTKPVADWMTFHLAARLYFEGRLAELFDGAGFTAAMNAAFAGLLAHPIPFQPWVYPPSFLLLLLPFGLLPFWPAYGAFLAVSLGALLLAVRAFAHRPAHRWLLAAALMLSPAMAAGVLLGQNSLLTCALLLGSLAALPASPLVAGALLGLLSFKPQLGLLIPVALLAGRQYRAIASATVVAVGLAAASLAVFGPAAWVQWLEFAAGRGALYQQWVVENRLHGESVFAAVVALGGPARLAGAAQLGAILAAAGCVWWAYSRPMGRLVQAAVLLCAIVLSSPHLLSYDMLPAGLAAAMMLLVFQARGGGPGGRVACLVVWAAPIVTVLVHSWLAITLIAGGCIGLLWFGRGDAARPASR